MRASRGCPSAAQTWVHRQARGPAGQVLARGCAAGRGRQGAARRAAVLAFEPFAREQRAVWRRQQVRRGARGWLWAAGRAAAAAGHARERVLLLEGSRLGLRLRLRPRGLGLALLSSLGQGWERGECEGGDAAAASPQAVACAPHGRATATVVGHCAAGLCSDVVGVCCSTLRDGPPIATPQASARPLIAMWR